MRFTKNLVSFILSICLLATVNGWLSGKAAYSAEGPYLLKEPSTQIQETAQTGSSPQLRNDITAQEDAAIAKVSPAVVSIFGNSTTEQPQGPNWQIQLLQNLRLWPFQISRTARVTTITAGSGFFINPNGYILTNKHVVSDTNSDFSATLENGDKKPAQVVYRDPNNDLAILKIDGHNYPTVTLGDSSSLKIGQVVVSIGNAFGQYPDTVSEGVISSLKRNIVTQDETTGRSVSNSVLQTSAQLYPGDSGGPLFDLSGNVVGINMAIASSRNNMSFCIPINYAKNLINKYSSASQ